MTAAIAGVGYTAFTKESDRSVLDLAAEACSTALDDAGLEAGEVDGMASFMVMHDSVPCQAVATCLAIPELKVALDLDLGGQAPCYLVWLAANLVEAGVADAIVVFRAMNGRSAARVGTMQFAGMGGQFRYPIGYDAYLMYVAMWGQRFLFETGQGEADLAGVVLNQRQYAVANERAVRRRPLDLDQYLASPMVVDPFRADDCTVEVEPTGPGRGPGWISETTCSGPTTAGTTPHTSLRGCLAAPGSRPEMCSWPRSTTASPRPCSSGSRGWAWSSGASPGHSSKAATPG
jgi:acetyl-CoA acetyltransferase